ncbi:MAG: MnhB domain-containing protein [Pseudomonadota bacterium]
MLLVFGLLLLCLSLVIIFAYDFILLLTLSMMSLAVMILYLLLGAPDVAMTEAALGVGLSTILIVNYMLVYKQGIKNSNNILWYLAFCWCIACVVGYCIDIDQLSLKGSALHDYYIEYTYKDIHINSFVAAILACYRGFDTFIETCVIFIGGIGVFYIAGYKQQQDMTDEFIVQQNNILVSNVVRILLMYMLIFAIYIQLNGTVSPGGGFQFGGILASIVILANKFFLQNYKICPFLLIRIGAIGLLIYFLVGFMSLIFELNFLNYAYLHDKAYVARHIGIELVELGVALTVSSMLLLIYLVSKRFNV